MKKDGFVSMTLVFSFLIIFLFLLLAILNAYSEQNKYLKAINSKIKLKVNVPNDTEGAFYINNETYNTNNYILYIARGIK